MRKGQLCIVLVMLSIDQYMLVLARLQKPINTAGIKVTALFRIAHPNWERFFASLARLGTKGSQLSTY